MGADIRFDLNDKDRSGRVHDWFATAFRQQLAYSAGRAWHPSVDNGFFRSAGTGRLHDRDFQEDRYNAQRPYVTMRLKFDQLSPRRARPRAAAMMPLSPA